MVSIAEVRDVKDDRIDMRDIWAVSAAAAKPPRSLRAEDHGIEMPQSAFDEVVDVNL
ncbi:MAG: hypothetical protein ABSB35_30265 [Bryobacteraceae bacterium]|jgi:hypothetical protein